ncbi:putative lipoprotein with Yx(FWY)xxD motif [Saonia flava]|uniref:Putative lipoprotein with Yx(FWY)xxD motif n=1 Tax=Saonia flava TaxID=523696 RepID=A0A846QPW5_9FLAO|nr:hypothetical protein [Saonia flava]NJB70148.1 putative lipoprotein with Yx(FWY)xxD motif [Saonia flava]
MKKLLLLFVLSLIVISCSDDSDDTYNNPNPNPDSETETETEVGNSVGLRSDATFGEVLTNSEGKTLYFFGKDAKGASNCSGGCADVWPIFFTDDLTLDSGLSASDFGTITREDGEQQTTYKGWPLYLFTNDAATTDINGDNTNNFFVAKPDYSIMITVAQLVGRDSSGGETNLTSEFIAGDEETLYITDEKGNTLYIFINDKKNQNNFTAEDFSNNGVWPIFNTTIGSLPSILSADDFGTIDVFGESQLTYKGWPLYYFGQDQERGDNFGVGFPAAGIWPIINPDTEEAPEPDPNAVRISENTTFGNVMTNAEGMTLYFFGKDAKGTSNCSGGCSGVWPTFFAENLTLDAGLNADDFATITREDGAQQTTYKGWPLYLFANDASSGDINGDNANNFFVAKPDYSLMISVAQLVGRDSDGNETNLTGEYIPGDEETLYVTDDEGNTLYTFIGDKKNQNNFTADDFSNNGVWPIFHTSIEGLPSILDSSDFGTIDVFGESQLTYKGWPLYYFGQDQERGDNYGVGFPAAGVWPIINPDIEEAPEPEDTSSVAATYEVSNNGATAYLFSGNGLTDASNPDFTLKRGETYEFNVNTPGHPFLVKSVQGTGTANTFDDGVTNNGASTGTISFTVPNDAPNTLFYNCEFHGQMTGTITIVD